MASLALVNTPTFWHAVDRLGTGGSPLLNWRAALGGEFAIAEPCLKRLPLVADWIADPDDATKRLAIYPSGEDGYVAESELSPPHREAFELAPGDAQLHALDWSTLGAPLGAALGFIPLPQPEGAGQIRRTGFVQRKGTVTFVHVFLPAGTALDATGFLSELAGLGEVILHVPTARWLSAEIVAAANRQGVELRVIAEILAVADDERGSLHASQRPHKPAPSATRLKSILDVQPGWGWEELHVCLIDNGTLLASYGRHRSRYRFEKRGGKISKTFATLARLAWQGEWTNPRSGEGGHERLRKRFIRLRDILTELIPIPGDPFRIEGGIWTPVFHLELDAELQAILAQHANPETIDEDEEETADSK